MARLIGVDLPRDKRLEVALTYIFGIGRTRAAEISRVSRNTQGVTLMRLGKGEKLQAVQALDASLDEDEDAAGNAVAATETHSPQA